MTLPEEHARETTSPDELESDPPLLISHAEMDNAVEHGEARSLAESIGWITRYRDAWWVIYEDGWLRMITSVVTDQLDRLYPRLAAAEEAARRDRNPARKGNES